VLVVTQDEKTFLIGLVFFIGALYFLKNTKKWMPKKDIAWYLLGVFVAAAYVIWVIAKSLVVFYENVLTPVGHFLSDPSTWWHALGIVVIVGAAILIFFMVRGWWRENVPKK